MNIIDDPTTDIHDPLFIEAKTKLENQLKSGANWFTAIAALSLVNSMMFGLKINFFFAFGLGLTQLTDGIINLIAQRLVETSSRGQTVLFIGLGLDIAAAAIFLLLGHFAKQERKWAFIVGMLLYLGDGLLCVWIQNYIGFVVHVFVLYSLFRGYQAIDPLEKVYARFHAAAKIYLNSAVPKP